MAKQIKHTSNTVVDANGFISNSALRDSGVAAGPYGSDNTTLHTFTVDAKGRVTAASEASINVTGVTYANTNASGTASSNFAHAPNQKIFISSSAPDSDSIGSDGDIWYQTL